MMIPQEVEILECSIKTKNELNLLVGTLSDILKEKLKAVYLSGSLARNCHNPKTSDIDLLILSEQRIDSARKEAMLQVFNKTPSFFDVTSVTLEQVKKNIFPTPVDFLVKMNSKIVELPERSRDFLLERQDIYEVGIDLFGISHKKTVKKVPRHLLINCIHYIFPHIRTEFNNPILMLCRSVFCCKERHLCSKIEAGTWALQLFDSQFHRLIEEDLRNYRNGIKSDFNAAGLGTFEEYCLELMRRP